MQNTVKVGVFENDAGDEVILNYHTDTSRAYEQAGYRLAENADAKAASAMTAAAVLTEPEVIDTPASENARAKDDQDVRADPSAVAYPAGQLPTEVTVTGGAGETEPLSDQTIQDTENTGPGGTVPLTQAYDTPPTPDRNPSPERREMSAEARKADGEVDERGVHEHKDGEESGGAPTVGEAGSVPAPADLRGDNVVKQSQGAGKNGESSQGTSRPSARSRTKS